MRILLPLLGIFFMSLPSLAQRQSPSHVRTYPQLVATPYPTGTPLPAGVKAPTADFRFIDRAGLPAGAVITSAARTRQGAAWVVTDQGAFLRADGKYQPLVAARQFRLHGTEGAV